jgi:hypothetical protein
MLRCSKLHPVHINNLSSPGRGILPDEMMEAYQVMIDKKAKQIELCRKTETAPIDITRILIPG